MKLSPDCMPRPPARTMRALVSSGRSDWVNSWPTKLERPASPTLSTSSMAAEPPSAATGSKAVVRTVTTLIGSLDCTVAMALPA